MRLLLRMGDRAVMLDQRLAFIDEEFVLAIGAQQLDPGVAQVLVVDMKLLVAFGAARIEVLDHLGSALPLRLFLRPRVNDMLPLQASLLRR